MTVGELIEELKQFNADTRVEINYRTYSGSGHALDEHDDILKVETREATITVRGPNHSRTTRQETTVVLIGE